MTGGESEGGSDATRASVDAPGVRVPGAHVRHVHSPSTTHEVGEVVAEAARERRGLLIVGGRTRLHWANPARGIEAGLSTRALDGVDEFEPEEGVLHARAGTPIVEIRRIAAAEGWELPLDTPGESSTLGGTLATGVTGPRAMAFGQVKDAVLGLDVVGGDGVASKCGGRVVKNVTGYDMAKLYCGSYGSLAVITGAWLRLRPSPGVHKTLVARVDPGSFEACRGLGELTCVRALVWSQTDESSRAEVVVELAGSEEGVAHDDEQIAGRLDVTAVEATEAGGAETDRVDRLRDARASIGPESIALRARVLPTGCGDLARVILRAGLSVSIDPALGVVCARGELSESKRLVRIREASQAAGGFTTFENLPDAWRRDLDVFGEPDGTAALTSGLKRRFDPMGVLNPGRFVAGI